MSKKAFILSLVGIVIATIISIILIVKSNNKGDIEESYEQYINTSHEAVTPSISEESTSQDSSQVGETIVDDTSLEDVIKDYTEFTSDKVSETYSYYVGIQEVDDVIDAIRKSKGYASVYVESSETVDDTGEKVWHVLCDESVYWYIYLTADGDAYGLEDFLDPEWLPEEEEVDEGLY